MSGKIFGVISIKGGVGKTTVVSNLAASLAAQGKKVLAVDANFTAPNLGLHLGIASADKTLHEVIAGKFDAKEAIQNNECGFDVLPARLVAKEMDYLRLKRKISPLRNYYDYIIIDSSPNMNDEVLATMMTSDELIVVSSPDYPTLSCTMRAVKVARERKVPITGLVLNRVRNKSYELTVDEIEDASETPVIGIMPEDENVIRSLSETRPVVHVAPQRDVSVEYHKLAATIAGGQYRDKRVWSRIRNFFMTDGMSKVRVNRALVRERR